MTASDPIPDYLPSLIPLVPHSCLVDSHSLLNYLYYSPSTIHVLSSYSCLWLQIAILSVTENTNRCQKCGSSHRLRTWMATWREPQLTPAGNLSAISTPWLDDRITDGFAVMREDQWLARDCCHWDPRSLEAWRDVLERHPRVHPLFPRLRIWTSIS